MDFTPYNLSMRAMLSIPIASIVCLQKSYFDAHKHFDIFCGSANNISYYFVIIIVQLEAS